jgi:ribonuclease P protein component
MVCFYLPQNLNYVGFIASKKVGNAIKRNRAKRVLRAIFSKYEKDALKSGVYIFVAKSAIINEKFAKIELSFLECQKQLKTLKKGKI